MTAPVLEVRDLTIAFRSQQGARIEVVRDVCLELGPGQRLGLVGESGCGKTTTLLALMGLLPPNAEVSGSILLDGHDILAGGERSMRPHRWTDMAMVFQGAMNAFNPTQTVGSQIVEAMRIHGRARGRAAKTRAQELLELVGIPPERVDRYPHQFSGGMRQRAAMAMALANEPRILLADEPTTALDVIVQAQILELLERLCSELGLALLLVTHDLPLVIESCSSVAVMYAGRVVERAPVDRVYEQPHHPYTRLLFAAVPGLDLDQSVASLPGSPPRPGQEAVGCSFAPRCDVVQPICRQRTPVPLDVGHDHVAACHLAADDVETLVHERGATS
jgi:oligopeptide/dipeptide ABC transporter ATP-binding protein